MEEIPKEYKRVFLLEDRQEKINPPMHLYPHTCCAEQACSGVGSYIFPRPLDSAIYPSLRFGPKPSAEKNIVLKDGLASFVSFAGNVRKMSDETAKIFDDCFDQFELKALEKGLYVRRFWITKQDHAKNLKQLIQARKEAGKLQEAYALKKQEELKEKRKLQREQRKAEAEAQRKKTDFLTNTDTEKQATKSPKSPKSSKEAKTSKEDKASKTSTKTTKTAKSAKTTKATKASKK